MKRDLLWYIFMLMTFVVIAVAWYLGLFALLLAFDVTYLSFFIIAIYTVLSLLLCIPGFRTRDKLDGYWFASEQFLNLGLLGSLIGLLYVFSGLTALPIGVTVEAMKPIMTKVAIGVSTKLYCSAVGLASSIAMKCQLWILEKL